MVKSLKCSRLHTREITVPNCLDEPEYCSRTYHIFLPDILCSGVSRKRQLKGIERNTAAVDYSFFDGEYHNVGTIPMVFVLHGLGADARSMAGFAQGAEDYHFVIVLPEGINQSFNAGGCCGDAHQFGVHDVDFLNYIRQELSNEFDFLKAEYTYGIGWDNGALLLTEALTKYPQLFRSIVPISGYMMQSSIPPTIGKGIGAMMHHSLDDLTMRPSGCCEDLSMPECRSDLNTKSCVSVLDSFDSWVRDVNLCDGEGQNDKSGDKAHLVGGIGDHFYSLSLANGITSIALENAINEKGEDSSTFFSSSDVALSVTQQTQSHVCLTTTSPSCLATSTLCLYKDMGHFDGFVSTPYMSSHVMEFLARDACGINDGLWNLIPRKTGGHNQRVCGCSTDGFDGVFCLDRLIDESDATKTSLTGEHSFDLSTDVLTKIQPASPIDVISPPQRPYWTIGIVGSVLFAAVAATIYKSSKPRTLKKRSTVTNDNPKMDTWRGLHTRKGEGKVSPNDGTECGMLSLPNCRLEIHQSLSGSIRSLEPLDMELLDYYRDQSGGSDDSLKITEEDSTSSSLDQELLNFYRQRQQNEHQIKQEDNAISTSERSFLGRMGSIDDILFDEVERSIRRNDSKE